MEEQKVTLRLEGRIAIVEINNPPVNALSHAVRSGLKEKVTEASANADVDAIIVACIGRTFAAGADITEFGKPPQEPSLPDVINSIEASEKPVVAAIHGTAFGGGFEIALGCHFRVAVKSAQVGLPEVKLGLIPGAGGTQRLPRLIGPVLALEPIVTGNPMGADKAEKLGILDEVYDDNLLENALSFTQKVLSENRPVLRNSQRDDKLEALRKDATELDATASKLLRRSRGLHAPAACAESVKNTLTMSFDDGLKQEREFFIQLRDGEQSKAQRHLFFAERAALKIPDMPKETKARDIKRVAVLGAGTMGGGITMSIASAGIPVTMIDLDEKALERGLGTIEKNYQKTAQRGGLTEQQVEAALSMIDGSTDFDKVSEADLVIEAVFENLELKKKIFRDLDEKTRPGTILASNTSYLDIDVIAAETSRPGDVIGMHFFSPANVMKLLEIVRAKETKLDVLKTAIDIGKRSGKVPVTVGVCYGFVGNRMLRSRSMQVEKLLLEGASPAQIDRVSTEFGFAMGPCAVGDLAGLDIGYKARQDSGAKAPVADAICELGRFGQKTGKGYYLYEEGSRSPIPDPEIEALIKNVAKEQGVEQREISDEELHARLVYSLINEGARIMEEGIASRSSDIDLIWINGYGWPVGRGGPMFYADSVGAEEIVKQLNIYAEATGDENLRPAPLLVKLAGEGKKFEEL
ncbi:MAG: 3-hydroxyacyl-CoA dehydrogenase NAD-binding domain-containing protein [Methyloligellaceae bacterium]